MAIASIIRPAPYIVCSSSSICSRVLIIGQSALVPPLGPHLLQVSLHLGIITA